VKSTSSLRPQCVPIRKETANASALQLLGVKKSVLVGVKTRPRPTLRGRGHPLEPASVCAPLVTLSSRNTSTVLILQGFSTAVHNTIRHSSRSDGRSGARLGEEIPTPLPFGLGPARLAKPDPIRGMRQKSVSRPDDRARPRCLTARPPFSMPFWPISEESGKSLVARGLGLRFSLSHSSSKAPRTGLGPRRAKGTHSAASAFWGVVLAARTRTSLRCRGRGYPYRLGETGPDPGAL
jgi:hypothetical protein